MNNNILNQLSSIILQKTGIVMSNTDLDTPLEDFKIDSLELFEIIVKIEDKLDFELDDMDIFKIKTFNDFLKLLYNTKYKMVEKLWNNIVIVPHVYVDMGKEKAIYLKRHYGDCFIIEDISIEIFEYLKNKRNLNELITLLSKKYYNFDNNIFIEDVDMFIKDLINSNIAISSIYKKDINCSTINENESLSVYETNIYQVQNYYLENRKPYKVFLELTYNCNLKCDHCYLGEEKYTNSNLLNLNDYKNIINSLEKSGVVELVITGGEIGLFKDLIELIDFVDKKNMLVTLLTNGTCFNESIIEKICSSSIHDIKISIYGNEFFHDNFVKSPGSFKKSLNTLKIIKNNVNIGSASCVLTNENISYIDQLKDVLNKELIPLNITPVIFPTVYGDKTPLNLRLNKDELSKSIKKYNLRLGGSICTAGICRFRITPSGEVNPCEMLRHINLGNIKDSSFQKILENDKRINWLNSFFNLKNNKCMNCSKSKYCVNCIGLSYLETGNMTNITSFSCELAHVQNNIYEKVNEEMYETV